MDVLRHYRRTPKAEESLLPGWSPVPNGAGRSDRSKPDPDATADSAETDQPDEKKLQAILEGGAFVRLAQKNWLPSTAACWDAKMNA